MNLYSLIPKLFLISVLVSTTFINWIPRLQSKQSTMIEGSNEVSIPQETIKVPFESGTSGVQTTQSYDGEITVSVSGVGQASGTEWSDAFYIFTNSAGQPVEPYHPLEYYNFTLWIEGGPADIHVKPIPEYNEAHTYVFFLRSSGNPINFGVGDVFTIDNTGHYTITISEVFINFIPLIEN